MKVKGVRLYGAEDLRTEEFDLPELQEDEILLRIISDSLCMSTWKESKLGAEHIRVPNDLPYSLESPAAWALPDTPSPISAAM